MPPPPLSAAAPWASLSEIVAPVTVMVPPAEFHRPPPSLVASFASTVVPTMETVPAPVRCSPPPLPGAEPAVFSDSVPPVIVVRPPTDSMPPPARTALLP